MMVFGFLLILAGFAQAEPITQINYQTPELKTSCEAALKSVFTDLEKMAPGHFILPQKLTVEVSAVARFPDEDNGVMRVAEQIDLGKGLKSDAIYFKTLVAHEYGHAILHENLMSSPELKDYFIKAKLPHNQQIAFRDFFNAYDEFFADLISALLDRDGSIVAKSISPEGSSPKDLAAAAYRDFKLQRSPAGWNYVGPYGRFSPARGALWDLIEKDPAYLAEFSGVVIERVIAVIRAQSLKQLVSLSAKDFPEPELPAPGEIEKMNIDFISMLKNTMTGHELSSKSKITNKRRPASAVK